MRYKRRPNHIGCAFNEAAIERMLDLRFKKKPIVVEAHRVNVYNDPESFKKLASWCGGTITTLSDGSMSIVIETLEGDMTAVDGDWIIKGLAGEFYPCKPSIFEMSYERTYDD